MLIKSLGMAGLTGLALKDKKEAKCWIYRDDIGAFWGIKGYEEQVTEVGDHKGNVEKMFPQHRNFGTWDAGSVRRGAQVFMQNCATCHGLQYRKYDTMLDKGFKQLELAKFVGLQSITPAHLHFKGYYFQEWDERDRVIADFMYSPYVSQDQAKKANGGVWPVDFSKINRRPGTIMYIYNVLTGYHFKAPLGVNVPKGKHFNPYFDHMVIGMPRQLQDGMVDYWDGTPASTPQMAYDVSNFITYMQRRVGATGPDKKFRKRVFQLSILLMAPLCYIAINGFMRNPNAYRIEAYAIRDGVYYNHFRTGMRNVRANDQKAKTWV